MTLTITFFNKNKPRSGFIFFAKKQNFVAMCLKRLTTVYNKYYNFPSNLVGIAFVFCNVVSQFFR